MHVAPRGASAWPSNAGRKQQLPAGIIEEGASAGIDAGRASVGRIVRSADFERILASRPVARTARFAIHHLKSRPLDFLPRKLSTAAPDAAITASGLPGGRWLGLVVPKRHAKRAVTRSLLKRQMRQRFLSAFEGLEEGLWVIRLKAPFDRTQFPSAASDALRMAAGTELGDLFARSKRRDVA